MTRSISVCAGAAALLAFPLAAQDLVTLTFSSGDLFTLTLNSLPPPEELTRLEELFDVPPGLLADDIATLGFSSRVLPLRQAGDVAAVQGALNDLGIVLPQEPVVEGPVIASAEAPPRFDFDFPEAGWIGGFTAEMTMVPDVIIMDGPVFQDADTTIDIDNILGPVNVVPKDSSQPAVSSLLVTQGLPAGASVMQASSGDCTATRANWPFDAAKVADVIRFGDAVLAEAGLGDPLRARILVVDSGLPAALIERPEFARMLEVNWTEAMGGGLFSASPEDADRNKSCEDPDDDGGAVRYGFVTQSVTLAEPETYCGAADPMASIAPPIPGQPMTDYEPGHGAIVAGLAVGGPALLAEMPELNAHVGVAMARIARLVETQGNPAMVASDVNDAANGIARAIHPFTGIFAVTGHPQTRRFDVLNLSLSIAPTAKSPNWRGLLDEYTRSGGLVVVAAGNGALKIQTENPINASDLSLIGALSDEVGVDHAITVGGTQPLGDGVAPHPESNWSPSLVDIAAPATGALSWGVDGEPACAVGTSISTPQVSFVAAMLVSFGMWSNAEVKRRILATADIEPALFDTVRRGRSLNVASALDVFADLVWLLDPADPARIAHDPLRVRILDTGGTATGMMLHICSEAGDFIDSRSLVLWERRPDGLVEYWRDGSPMTALNNTCTPGDGEVEVVHLDGGRIETLQLSDIARIVPSRFRLGAEVLRVAGVE